MWRTMKSWRGRWRPMLKMEGLTASYGEIEVLHGIDVEVSQGEIVAVIGANSSGKSTMLTCISRLMPITGGSMTFCGADISRMRPEEVVNLGLIQCPEGRQLFSEADCPGEPGTGSLLQESQGRQGPHAGTGLCVSPAAQGAGKPTGGHPQRRGGADAGHWAEYDGKAQAFNAG